MDDRVIEAAAKAIMTLLPIRPTGAQLAESAITAALRELAPDILAAVDALQAAGQGVDEAMRAWDRTLYDSDHQAYQAAIERMKQSRRDLLALLGIEDTTG